MSQPWHVLTLLGNLSRFPNNVAHVEESKKTGLVTISSLLLSLPSKNEPVISYTVQSNSSLFLYS